MLQKMPTVALVGAGYWGKNLVRNFYELGALHSICDSRAEVVAAMLAQYPGARAAESFEALLADRSVSALALATPAVSHFDLARRALLAGKHVFVEKPLAMTAAQGRQLVELAQKSGLILLVDHILQKHPAYRRLAELARAGELGRLRHIRSNRLSFGKIRVEEDVLWSFAPHDISMILGLTGALPGSVTAVGHDWLTRGVADRVDATLDFGPNLSAAISVSWLNPVKEQKLVVVGDKKMAVFDDTLPHGEKLRLYAHQPDFTGPAPQAISAAPEAVDIPEGEPLKAQCRDFLAAAAGESQSLDPWEGWRVLTVLEALSASLAENGARRRVLADEPEYFAHPTAVIDEGALIGRGTNIWHFSHVLAGSEVGENCNLGQNVVLGPNVKAGRGVKIQNNVSVYEGVTLEDDVFCGPGMVFTNVFNPRANVPRKSEYRPTVLKRGATVGANATVVCGHTLGEWCFIGAGAVVTKDVPAHALMLGNPARRRGWVCRCGCKLPPELLCGECGRSYHENNGQLEGDE